MTDKALKVWNIAKSEGLDALLENSVDDLEEFAEDINIDSDKAVLDALYKKFC